MLFKLSFDVMTTNSSNISKRIAVGRKEGANIGMLELYDNNNQLPRKNGAPHVVIL